VTASELAVCISLRIKLWVAVVKLSQLTPPDGVEVEVKTNPMNGKMGFWLLSEVDPGTYDRIVY
jgi:hypothetical protein